MVDQEDIQDTYALPDDAFSVVEEPNGGGVASYRELWVWKRAMELVRTVYTLTDKLPEEEKFGLKSQLRRAAVSVPSNIAEGWGRNKGGYFKQSLAYSRGSLHEVETQLLICREIGFLHGAEIDSLLKSIGGYSASILRLMNKL